MSFPSIKVPLLLLAALAHHKGTQPPNPPPTKSDQVNKSSFFEVNPRLAVFVVKALGLSLLLLEAALIVLLPLKESDATIDRVVATICPVNHVPRELTTLSTTFITGVTMLCLGAIIRLWCYKALGTLFTFEITIRPNHKLVTWGPYAYVRHPSYTGTLLLFSGSLITALGANSYVDACGIMTKSIFMPWILGLWAVFSFYVIYSVFSRGPVEDAELKKVFGEEWVGYAQRVPYKCIPGIY